MTTVKSLKKKLSGNDSSDGDAEMLVKFEYHVLFSSSYEVPVLYFQASHSDGSSLTVEEIWLNIPDVYKCQQQTSSESGLEGNLTYSQFGNVITQVDHPFLGLPFFMIHPCHTSALMAKILTVKDSSESAQGDKKEESEINVTEEESSEDKRRKYFLLTWITTVGPVTGLTVDLSLAKKWVDL